MGRRSGGADTCCAVIELSGTPVWCGFLFAVASITPPEEKLFEREMSFVILSLGLPRPRLGGRRVGYPRLREGSGWVVWAGSEEQGRCVRPLAQRLSPHKSPSKRKRGLVGGTGARGGAAPCCGWCWRRVPRLHSASGGARAVTAGSCWRCPWHHPAPRKGRRQPHSAAAAQAA
jgi:hypothetical protein